jgi:molecular chaperone DnaK (HSP70)
MGTDSKRLTISIDFGTTYSGVAYSHPGDVSADNIFSQLLPDDKTGKK